MNRRDNRGKPQKANDGTRDTDNQPGIVHGVNLRMRSRLFRLAQALPHAWRLFLGEGIELAKA